MTPTALRAAIASARLRPRMYGTDAHDLSGYLHGLTAGAYDGPLNVAAQWQSAWTTAGWRPNDPRADDVVCDVADRVVAALWPQGDAPARRTAEAGALDLAAIEARANAATMWRPDECELRDEDGEPWAPQGATLGETLITLGDTYDGSASDWCFVAHARTDVPALVARVRELEVQVAAAQPAVARDALRNGRFTAHCCACSAEWPLGVRDCPGCGHPDRDAGAVPDRDLCPHCGALDLDHVCAKSAATVAGEAFATEHPEAAGRILG